MKLTTTGFLLLDSGRILIASGPIHLTLMTDLPGSLCVYGPIALSLGPTTFVSTPEETFQCRVLLGHILPSSRSARGVLFLGPSRVQASGSLYRLSAPHVSLTFQGSPRRGEWEGQAALLPRGARAVRVVCGREVFEGEEVRDG